MPDICIYMDIYISTYRSANRLAGVTGKHPSKQTSLVNFFQRKEAEENEPSTSSSNMNETNQDK